VITRTSQATRPVITPPARTTFAEQVTAWRDKRNWSQSQLASRMGFDSSYVSHIENGSKPPTLTFAEKCDEAFDLPGTFIALHKDVGLGEPDSTTVADAESDACTMSVWESRVVPGLLQTPDYTRAQSRAGLWPADRTERELKIRLERQGVLNRLVAGWFVLSEAVLRLEYGGRDVMHVQLLHLEAIAAKRNIRIQIMPFRSTEHPGGDGPLSVIEYADRPAIWFTEGRTTGRMSTDRTEVMQAQYALNIIRAAALPISESIALIQQVRETHYGELA
jgi:transcriptional regulator with XRE-family HTH domain